MTPSRVSEADDERDSSMVKASEQPAILISSVKATTQFEIEEKSQPRITVTPADNPESEDLDEIERLERELEMQMLEED